MVKNAVGKGYAKAILFGEHFTEYNLPGIATGLDKYVEVKGEIVKDSDDVIFDDKVFSEKISMKEKPDHIKCKMLKAMFGEDQFVKLTGIKLVINSNFSPSIGLGYSAALAVALARVMSQLFDLDLKDDQVNEIAHKSEQIIHGSPSGMDTACATYDSVIWFEKRNQEKKDCARKIKCAKPLLCLLVDSGAKKSKETSELIKKQKEKDPKAFDKLCAEYKTIVGKAKTEIQYGGVEAIGKLMNQNQALLSQLGVSTKETDEIIKVATFGGALGAKITGENHGEKIIVLCYNEVQQEKLIASFAARNYKAVKTKIS